MTGIVFTTLYIIRKKKIMKFGFKEFNSWVV